MELLSTKELHRRDRWSSDDISNLVLESEVRLDVVLRGYHARLQRGAEGVLAHLEEPRGTKALFRDHGGTASDDGFLRDTVQVAAAFLDIRTRLRNCLSRSADRA